MVTGSTDGPAMLVAVVVATVLGLLFGSFANVPIHRWPRGGGVGQPRRSACPSCDRTIAARDNVPVVSWLLLRARCRHCGAAIHWRYPLVEAATGLLFGAVTLVEGVTWLLPALLALTWSLVVATAIDVEHRIIPNRLTYRLPVVLLVLLVPPTLLGPGSVEDLVRGVVVGVAAPGGMLLVAELYRRLRGRMGFGMGDVKLLVSLGLVVGYVGLVEVAILLYGAMFSGVLVAGGLMLAGRARMASRIPFGPYLAVGGFLAILVGDRLRGPVLRFLGL